MPLNGNRIKSKANHLPPRCAIQLLLTWAIFTSARLKSIRGTSGPAAASSSSWERFQTPGPLPGKGPCAFPLSLAWAHSNTNRPGEQQAWPESRQTWQLLSVCDAPGSPESRLPSRASVSWKVPPHLPFQREKVPNLCSWCTCSALSITTQRC